MGSPPAWDNSCLAKGGYQNQHSYSIKAVHIDIILAGSDHMRSVTKGVLRIRCEALLTGIVSGQEHYFVATNGLALVAGYLTFDCEPTMANATPFYLLPLFQELEKKPECIYIQGLILKPTNKCEEEYERIGIFEKMILGV
jgi:hypothetical protein